MGHEERLLLWTARETGVLDALSTEASTPEQVADSTGITERAAEITVSALAEYGYFERVDGTYEPTNRALGFLSKTDVRSIGAAPHSLDSLSRWFALPETMRTGEVPDSPEHWTRNCMGAMATVDDSTIRASVTAAEHAHPDRIACST